MQTIIHLHLHLIFVVGGAPLVRDGAVVQTLGVEPLELPVNVTSLVIYIHRYSGVYCTYMGTLLELQHYFALAEGGGYNNQFPSTAAK